MTLEQAKVVMGALAVCDGEGVNPHCGPRYLGRDAVPAERLPEVEQEIILAIYKKWPDLIDKYSHLHVVQQMESAGKIQVG